MHLNFAEFSVKGLKVIAVQSEIIMSAKAKDIRPESSCMF